MKRAFATSLSISLSLVSAGAKASETMTYSYDAKGRLIKVVHMGSVNNGITVVYSHDAASNRNHVTVTGAH